MKKKSIKLTEEENTILFHLIKKMNAQRYKGNFPMTKEEQEFLNGTLLYQVSHGDYK